MTYIWGFVYVKILLCHGVHRVALSPTVTYGHLCTVHIFHPNNPLSIFNWLNTDTAIMVAFFAFVLVSQFPFFKSYTKNLIKKEEKVTRRIYLFLKLHEPANQRGEGVGSPN